MVPPKPLDLDSLIQHTGTATLPTFCRLLSHEPPVGAAILYRMNAQLGKALDSKDVTTLRKLLGFVLDGFRRGLDFG